MHHIQNSRVQTHTRTHSRILYTYTRRKHAKLNLYSLYCDFGFDFFLKRSSSRVCLPASTASTAASLHIFGFFFSFSLSLSSVFRSSSKTDLYLFRARARAFAAVVINKQNELINNKSAFFFKFEKKRIKNEST